ncbi:lysophospholipid acyltransferase family protein [Pelagibacterium luteolum]|uniref:Lyso-ornithine lipid acyltransferase n=1 Tax=Pelagibacterium luteolum TaxID=440168 RepID=A0A1G7SLS9_9HYPH|nr:1-acyl-sn-glycerol-3-phosphate acyltransferase [Pelagibacterium luteolum]SDG23872.1 lyso-ornithine lipid acyltransferase [Pelagibacterium luteolum]
MVLRLAFLSLVLLPFTLVGLPVQLVVLALRLPEWWVLPLVFFKIAAFGLGLRVRVVGEPLQKAPVLLVANHTGWLDIIAIASKIPVSFVAKSDVGGWPIIGWLARLQKTVFVDRTRRTDTGRTSGEMRDRLASGTPVLLFAEGTSDIGTHVLPFRSALLGAAMDDKTLIQPLAIAYTAISGLPLSRHERPVLAWVGDMALGDNLWSILKSGPKDITIALGTPFAGNGDRKASAQRAHAQVRQMLNALNRRHPLPNPQDLV